MLLQHFCNVQMLSRLLLIDVRFRDLQEDFCMGAVAGAFAAAATTPLDVIKTSMMCTAASRPTMTSATVAAWQNVRLLLFNATSSAVPHACCCLL